MQSLASFSAKRTKKFFKGSAEKTWDELYPELDRTVSPVPNITPETEVRQ